MVSASKIKSEPKRKRFPDTGISLPDDFILKLKAISLNNGSNNIDTAHDTKQLCTLATKINSLHELRSAHLQSHALKDILSLLPEFEDLNSGLELVLGLLHAPNSRPAHRQILAGLKSLATTLNDESTNEIVFAAITADMAQHAQQISKDLESSDPATHAKGINACMQLASPLTSLISFPHSEFVPALKPLAGELTRCMAAGVAAIADLKSVQAIEQPSQASNLSNGSEVIMREEEERQQQVGNMSVPMSSITAIQQSRASVKDFPDIISNLYSLISLFGQDMVREPSRDAAQQAQHASCQDHVLVAAMKSILAILQSSVVGYEMMSTVGAALHVTCALPAVDSLELALLYARAFFLPSADAQVGIKSSSSTTTTDKRLENTELSEGLFVGQELYKQGIDIVEELKKVPAENMVPAVRGLIQCLPLNVLYAPLVILIQQQQQHQKQEEEKEMAQPWCLLTDGALIMMCNLTEEAGNISIKVAALSSVATILDLIKQYWEHNKEQQKETETVGVLPVERIVPVLSQYHCQRVSCLLWTSWDDKIPQAARAAGSIFTTLLDILDAQEEEEEEENAEERKADEFLLHAARDLLARSVRRKGRYPPLTAIIPRLGASRILSLQPDLVETSIMAMTQLNTLSGPVASMLSVLWSTLRKEEEHYVEDVWRGRWKNALLPALCGNNELLRSNVCIYVVPIVLDHDPGALGFLLAEITKTDSDAAVAASVALLKTARKHRLLEDLTAVPVGAEAVGLTAQDIARMLRHAVVHSSDAVRVDALDLVCTHVKQVAIPSHLELDIVREALMLTLRCPTTATRSKMLPCFHRLLLRLKACADAVSIRPRDFEVDAPEKIEACAAWCRELSSSLVASLYPGANYEREYMALALLNLMLENLGSPGSRPDASTMEDNDGSSRGGDVRKNVDFHPFHPVLLTPGAINLLIGSVADNWDKIRDNAAHTLCMLPSPLPGYTTPTSLLSLLRHACDLTFQPRLPLADAGARLLLLIMQQYVLKLGWKISPGDIVGRHRNREKHLQEENEVQQAEHIITLPEQNMSTTEESSTEGEKAEVVLHFLQSMLDMFEHAVHAAQADLFTACLSSLAHGPLLAIRYIIMHVPWTRYAKISPEIAARAAGLVSRLLDLTTATVDIVVPVLASPEETNVGAEDVDADDIVLQNGTADDEGLAPTAQIIMCACWMSMKEVSLTLGTLAQIVPLKDTVLPIVLPSQLQHMGHLLLTSLCAMKHNGAVDKTQQGFIAIVSRLLSETAVPALHDLPAQWLKMLFDTMQRPGQSRSDIVRRSAGLPYAILGLFLGQPAGQQKALSKAGLTTLLAIAAGSDSSSVNNSSFCVDPWPRVHAFNTLRMAFSDTKLIIDTSEYCALGLETSIAGLSAREWEVRNAATLSYTALVTRMLGFANLATRDAAGIKAMGAIEFYTRYPRLHSFLLKQLEESTNMLLESGDVHPSLSPVLALLTRLKPSAAGPLKEKKARTFMDSSTTSTSMNADTGINQLRDSHDDNNKNNDKNLDKSGYRVMSPSSLSPCAFLELLLKCSGARQHALRVMAASSAAAFVPREERVVVAVELARGVAHMLSQLQGNRMRVRGDAKTLNPNTVVQEHATSNEPGVAALLNYLYQYQQQQQQQQPEEGNLNVVHGWLVQLRCLLDAAIKDAAADTTTTSTMEAGIEAVYYNELASSVAHNLKDCVYVCYPAEQQGCAALSLEMIRIVTALRALRPSTNFKEESSSSIFGVENVMSKASTACRAAMLSSSSFKERADGVQPMVSFVRKKATEAYFLYLLPYSKENNNNNTDGVSVFHQRLVDDVCCALQSTCYEVRSAALKCLVKMLDEERKDAHTMLSLRFTFFSLPPSELAALRAVLAVHAGHETHHKALRRTFHLLSLLSTNKSSYKSNTAAEAAVLEASAIQYEDALLKVVLHHAQAASDVGIKQHAITCLGSLLQSKLQKGGHTIGNNEEESMKENVTSEVLQSVLKILQYCTDPWQMSELRLAAVNAIQSSGLLAVRAFSAVSDELIRASITCWTLIVQLIEDEDGDVRNAACIAASNGMFSALSSSSLQEEELIYVSQHQERQHRRPCTERLIRDIFTDFDTRFGAHSFFLQHLMSWCCNPDTCAGELDGVTRGRAGLSSKKLFTKEGANNHEEQLFIAHLAAACLSRILVLSSATHHTTTSPSNLIESYRKVVQWVLQSCTILQHYLPALLNSSYAPPEIDEEEIFVPMYCLWLSLWSGGHLIKAIQSDLHSSFSSLVDGSNSGEERSVVDLIEESRTLVQELVAVVKKRVVCPQMESIARAAGKIWSVISDDEVDERTGGWTPDFLI